jgi:hypothetical protein
MPGTFRWIMNGMTLIAAPTMAQTPVATRPNTPISRASVPPVCGEPDGAFIVSASPVQVVGASRLILDAHEPTGKALQNLDGGR